MKCNSDYHLGICPARKYNGECVSEYPCRHKIEPQKLKANADHIRSMTDEELAELLFEMQDIEYDHKGQPLNWLKQPYKEYT